MKRKVIGVITAVMLTAGTFAQSEDPCAQPPGSDPCGCNAAQCECSQACEDAYEVAVAACGILGPIDGCDEAASVGLGICEAYCAVAWAACTAGCASG